MTKEKTYASDYDPLPPGSGPKMGSFPTVIDILSFAKIKYSVFKLDDGGFAIEVEDGDPGCYVQMEFSPTGQLERVAAWQ